VIRPQPACPGDSPKSGAIRAWHVVSTKVSAQWSSGIKLSPLPCPAGRRDAAKFLEVKEKNCRAGCECKRLLRLGGGGRAGSEESPSRQPMQPRGERNRKVRVGLWRLHVRVEGQSTGRGVWAREVGWAGAGSGGRVNRFQGRRSPKSVRAEAVFPHQTPSEHSSGRDCRRGNVLVKREGASSLHEVSGGEAGQR
jgi:hypothetical protein